MRVTNVMMTTNMMRNITNNKADMSKKFDQYATGQKIQKPSEDPVVAIRSLKYRANLTELQQYVDKNIPDAYQWMEITEGALKNMNELLTGMYYYCTQGAQDTYETIDRDKINQTLQQYKEQIYECLNTDNAGRYIFSGYRTDTPACFEEKTTGQEYEIIEPLTFENLFEKSYVLGGVGAVIPKILMDLKSEKSYVLGGVGAVANDETILSADEYKTILSADEYKQMAPTKKEAYCINLSYENIKSLTELSYEDENGATHYIYSADPNITCDYKLKSVNSTDSVSAYEIPDKNADGSDYEYDAHFVADTGELIVSKKVYEKLRSAKSISATYTKDEFEKGDIRPEMYFNCDVYDLVEDIGVSYTAPKEQDIYYEVNFSQKLKVNTMANETLNASLARNIDNIMNAVNDAYNTQQKIDNVKLQLNDNNLSEDAKEALKVLQEQLETELVLKQSIVQETFSNGMAAVKEAQDGTKVADADGTVKKISVSIANTSLGSRYKRLELIEDRLTNQETSFTEILDKNESVDLEDAIINYNAAEVTYNASLSAASKVVKNSLLDFI